MFVPFVTLYRLSLAADASSFRMIRLHSFCRSAKAYRDKTCWLRNPKAGAEGRDDGSTLTSGIEALCLESLVFAMTVDVLHVLVAVFFFGVWIGITLLLRWMQNDDSHHTIPDRDGLN